MSVGRLFRFKERASFEIRAEFSNIFNRAVLLNPSSTNASAAQLRNPAGQTTSGFEWINTKAVGTTSRQGTIVGRFPL
jgi:hypothetical protein